jgi:GTPase SAR1 family protein
MSAQPAPVHDPEVDAQLKRIVSLLQAEGRADAATELLTRHGAPPKAKPALFVAGEDKRGKSCLVNALLGHADLSPVGVEVVTAAPITFFASPKPAAHVFRYGNPMPQLEEFDHARSLATVAGNPRNQENVRSVGLGVDSPILEHLNLIDTPGVGGLDSGHATLTLQSLQAADALLFVSEAGAQFRAEELSFLRRAAARVDTVILVLTKIDLHRGWREVLEDDLAILKEQATRFANCPVVPVSSVLALRGLAAQDPKDAQMMREESGLVRLEQAINEHVVARASTLRDANVLRQGLGSLAAVELSLRETLAASGPDAAPRQALEAERARLQQLQKDRTLGLQTLDAEIRKMTLERSEDASRATVEIRRRYEERLRDVKKKEFDELPGELVADLTALAARLNEEASNRLTELVGKLIGDLDSAAPLSEAIHAVTAAGLQHDLEATPMGEHSLSGYDKVSVLTSFSSGHSISTLTGILASALIAPPFGLILGFGLGGMFAFQAFISRDQQHFVQAFGSWMTAQISQATLTINSTFQRQMIDLQSQLRDAVQQALAQREQEIATALRNAEAVLQSETAKQAQTTTQMRGRLNEVVQARAATLTLLQNLSIGDLAPDLGAAAAAAIAPAPVAGGSPAATPAGPTAPPAPAAAADVANGQASPPAVAASPTPAPAQAAPESRPATTS